MQSQPGVCGEGTVNIGLADQPLQGSIAGGELRSVGEDDSFELSACATAGDPDEPNAVLSFVWSCDEGGGGANCP
eukprot:2421576-Prymnesium_polylepis.1